MRHLLTVFTLVLFSVPAYAQNCVDTLWTRSFGTPLQDWCTGITEAGDGNYVLCGYINQQSVVQGWGYLVKITPDGATLWTRQYGGDNGDDIFHDIKRTSDGGYICAGITRSHAHNPPQSDFWLFRTNVNGDSLWQNHFGGQFADQAKAVIEVNGGYIIAGRSNSFSGTNHDIFVVKTNSSGDSIWGRTYDGGDSLEDNCNALIQAQNGDVILVGNSYRDDNAFQDLWILRINSVGDTVWTRRYLAEGSASAEAIIAYENGYLITGRGTGDITSDADGWLLHINQNGDTLWTENYGDTTHVENFFDVRIANDGGIVMFGNRQILSEPSDFYMVKANPDGGFGWNRLFGEEGVESLFGAQVLLNNRYLMAGATASIGLGQNDWWIVETEPDTCNMPPYGFQRLYPADEDTLFEPSPEITIQWSRAEDLNNDPIRYIIEIEGCVTPMEETTVDTFLVVQVCAEVSRDYISPVHWTVHATDLQDTVDAQNGEGLFYVTIASDAGDRILLAESYSLSAFPNPFNSTVSISYSLPQPSDVVLSLYDITGRLAATINHGTQSAGDHRILFNADKLTSGVYFLRANFESQFQTQKLLLLK